MAKNVGFAVVSTIVTPNAGDKFPVADSKDIKGGYHTVATVAEMNALTKKRRSEGMLVYVTETGETYRYAKNADTGKLEFSLKKDGVDKEEVSKLIEQVNALTSVCEDKFYVAEEENRTEFTLTHTPINDVALYIDGLRYFNSEDKPYFSYDKDTNTVTWLNTDEAKEGFVLSDMDVVFEYHYQKEQEV